jgi:hypothetical protein
MKQKNAVSQFGGLVSIAALKIVTVTLRYAKSRDMMAPPVYDCETARRMRSYRDMWRDAWRDQLDCFLSY